MLQGVLARGTARSIANLSPYVAGKTGTSDEENDAWFVGFTNDDTVAVWVGYDNADGKRRTLGGGSTGGSVAVPIFEPVIQAVWANVVPKAALAPPSPEAKRYLTCKSVELDSAEAQNRRRRAFSECFRLDEKARCVIPNMCWSRVKALLPNEKKTTAIEKAPLARGVSRILSTPEIPREKTGARGRRTHSRGHRSGDPTFVHVFAEETALLRAGAKLLQHARQATSDARWCSGLAKLYAGTKPATLRRYGETDDKTDEVI
jgi:membrane peptidoglycan carboxypeptidase